MFNYQYAMNLIKTLQNPQEFLTKMGIPKEYTDNPQNVEKYLLNNGRISQTQIEQARNMYQQMFKR